MSKPTRALSLLIVLAALAATWPAAAGGAQGSKVDICHVRGNGQFMLIHVARDAVGAHVVHGDALLGDAVPGIDGYIFGDGCTSLPLDSDGDGYEGPLGDGADCDDSDPDANPGASEILGNDVDEDCNGIALPASLLPPVRAAFMYPWFPKAWNQGGLFPFTQFTPSDGFYDSSDSLTINRQVEQATNAGLDAFIASWWGPGHHTDSAMTAIFDQLPKSPNPDFRVAIYYEQEGQSDPSAATIKEDLDYLELYFKQPNYLRIDDKPVVFVWADVNDRADMATRWSQAKDLFGDVYIVLKVFPGYRTAPDQPDSWHQYAPANRYDSQLPFAVTVSPGFWHAKDAAPRLERDPTVFRSELERMTKSGAFWQLVTSWNEWGEGTSIEPADEFGTTYLDILSDVLR